MEDLLQVGVITQTHGIRGEVKVFPTTDDAKRFKKLKNVILDNGKEKRELEITSVKFFKNLVILKFKDIDNINDVEKYKGCALLVSTDDLEELEENEFYYFEIIGCEVVTTDGEKIGEISEILETGANDVWVVKRQGQKDALIPYIEDVVKDVDIDTKTVTIQVLEGLL